MLFSYLKKGAANTIVYASASLCARAISFLFLPYMLTKLSIAEFGTWEFYQVIFANGVLMLSSCVGTSITRYFLLYKNNKERQIAALSNMCLLTIAGSAMCMLLSGALWVKNPTYTNYYALTLLNIALFAPFSLIISFIRVNEFFAYYLLCFCGQNLVATLLSVAAMHKGFNLVSLFYANALSLLLFLPLFVHLAATQKQYDVTLLREQLYYSIPLLIYALIYNLFFTVDKLALKYYCGSEILGVYGLLWRFGSIFQFFSIALLDALPLVLFNADHDTNDSTIISKILNYFCLTIVVAALTIMILSGYAIQHFLPDNYFHITNYLPFFFFSLLILEIGRILMQPSVLAKKTIYNPLITLLSTAIQCIALYIFSASGLQGIFCANICGFICFVLLNYYVGTYIYKTNVIDRNSIRKTIFIATLYFCAAHGLMIQKISPIAWCFFMLVFLATVWRYILYDKDKQILNGMIRIKIFPQAKLH